jgi:phospholipase/lecithinase/hemolysin
VNRFALPMALALLLSPGTTARADFLHGIGAMGSSTTEEYQFQGGARATARNWVEILASTRGLNFGGFTTASRGEPRNQGYEYDWGRVGATTAGLLSQGQHTGLAGQVARGEVTLAFLWIGTNDFRGVLNAPVPPPSLSPSVVPAAVANFTTALNAVLAAGPDVRVVVANTYDERLLPYVGQRVASGQLSQGLVDEVSLAIRQYNAQITAIALSDSRVAVTDLAGLLEGVMAPAQFSVGGLEMDRINSGIQPDHFFVDNLHPGTVGQALIANAFIDTIDTRFGAGVRRLDEAEIVAFARAVPEPSSLALMTLGTIALVRFGLRSRRKGSTSGRDES